MFYRAFQWGILVVVSSRLAAGEEEPGWHNFQLKDGSSFTARLMEEQAESYTLLCQGLILQVEKSSVQAVTPAAPGEETASPSQDAPPPSPRPEPAAAKRSPEALELDRLRQAIASLAQDDDARSPQAYLLLSSHLSRARPLLHQALHHRDRNLRGKVLKLLGAMGSPREDLPVVAAAVSDPDQGVRLAAVQALRALGEERPPANGGPATSGAPVGGRKPAAKVPEGPRDLRVVSILADQFSREKDREVREIIQRALEELSGRKLGKDPLAWKAWLEAEATSANLEKMLRSRAEVDSQQSTVESDK